MHKVQEVAIDIAIAIGHRLPAPTDRNRNVFVGQQDQRPATRICRVSRDDIGAVNLPWTVSTFDPHDLIRPVGAVEHRDRAGKPVAA